MTPTHFLETMMAIDALYPFSVTGGKRTHKRNALVGGVTKSRHLLWLAMDVVLDESEQAQDFVAECTRQGLLALIESNHIHVQVTP